MSDTSSLVAALLATARGRIISALVIIVLVLGVAAEVISIVTGYYNMVKARNDSIISDVKAKAATLPMPGEKTAPTPAMRTLGGSPPGSQRIFRINNMDDCLKFDGKTQKECFKGVVANGPRKAFDFTPEP
jgi:hypothetical protein